LKLATVLNVKRKNKPSFTKNLKNIIAFFRLINKLGFKPPTCFYFWRNISFVLFTNPSAFLEECNLIAMFIHFRKQTEFIIKLMAANQKSSGIENSVL